MTVFSGWRRIEVLRIRVARRLKKRRLATPQARIESALERSRARARRSSPEDGTGVPGGIVPPSNRKFVRAFIDSGLSSGWRDIAQRIACSVRGARAGLS
jgi:hypothetical protein